MNELFDQLILRVIFSIFICLFIWLTIVLYKFAHSILQSGTKQKVSKKFYPSHNSAFTLHFFSRVIGVGIIFSGLYFHVQEGLTFAIFTFFIQSIVNFALYVISIYILESIVLFNFEYHNEIMKRKNMCYSAISFSLAICVAFIINSVMMWESRFHLEKLFSWLYSIVILGVLTKFYKVNTKFNFNQLMIHKNLSLAFSYSGYLFGITIIIMSAFQQKFTHIEIYTLKILLNIILSAILFPIFRSGLTWAFKLEEDYESPQMPEQDDSNEMLAPKIGFGIYEGAIFFTSCFLTSIVTGHIPFESFYQFELIK